MIMKLCIPTLIFICCAISAAASQPLDTVELVYDRADTILSHQPKSEIDLYTLHNFYGSTTVGFDITSYGQSLEIHGAELVVYDERDSTLIFRTLSPFSHTIAVPDKDRIVKTRFKLKFPYTQYIGGEDAELRLFTDRGEIRLYLDEDRRTEEKLRSQQSVYEQSQNKLSRRNNLLKTLLFIAVALAVVIAVAFSWLFRHRKHKNDAEIDRLQLLLSENAATDRELKEKIDRLYRGKFDTLNMLCNEYFEKGTSEKLRLTIFNEVEKEIMKLRNPKHIVELEQTVNTYMDDIMVKARRQLSFLRHDDFILLTYLYSGLSARAICILTDIKIKNFYSRRQRLKDKILASGVPDAGWFAAKM